MFVVVFLVSMVVYSASPVVLNGDSYPAFPTAVSLVNRRSLDLDVYDGDSKLATHYGVARVDGHLMTNFPWADAVFAVPAVVAIDLSHWALGTPSADEIVQRDEMGAFQLLSGALVTAVAAALLGVLAYALMTGEMRRRRRLAIISGLTFAFGTTAWSVASRSLWGHGPSIMFLALGLLLLLHVTRAKPDPMFPVSCLCGAAFAVSVTVRPANAIPLVVTLVVVVVYLRRSAIAFGVGMAIVLVPWLAVTRLAYGSWLQTYNHVDRLSIHSHYLEALAANLVSPARGLLVFSPVVLLALPGSYLLLRHRPGLRPLTVVSLCVPPLYLFAVSGLGSNWWAGDSFGPRFMTDALPFLFVLAVPFADWVSAGDRKARTGGRTAALAVSIVLVATSVVINAQGGVIRASSCWNVEPTPVSADQGRIWSWSDPMFTRGLRSLSTLSLHESILRRCAEPTA